MNDGITLVLDRQQLQLSVEHHALRVSYPDGSFRRFPPKLLSQVMIHGNPVVHCDAWRLLAEHGVPVALFPGRGRGDAVWVGNGLATTVQYRIRQHALCADAERRLEWAKHFVHNKLRASQNVARWLQRPVPEGLAIAMSNVAVARNTAALMGIEGTAARQWYAWLRTQLPEHWGFEQRNRRPPKDPINALLSLGYTQITGLIHREVQSSGMDPYVGFLHETTSGRPSLSLDVAEAFRPWVDAFVISIVDRLLTPDEFTHSDIEGCRLSKEARRRYYLAWEGWLQQWPGITVTSEDGHDMNLCHRAIRQHIEQLRTLLLTGDAP